MQVERTTTYIRHIEDPDGHAVEVEDKPKGYDVYKAPPASDQRSSRYAYASTPQGLPTEPEMAVVGAWSRIYHDNKAKTEACDPVEVSVTLYRFIAGNPYRMEPTREPVSLLPTFKARSMKLGETKGLHGAAAVEAYLLGEIQINPHQLWQFGLEAASDLKLTGRALLNANRVIAIAVALHHGLSVDRFDQLTGL